MLYNPHKYDGHLRLLIDDFCQQNGIHRKKPIIVDSRANDIGNRLREHWTGKVSSHYHRELK
jgi:hypothetical protein